MGSKSKKVKVEFGIGAMGMAKLREKLKNRRKMVLPPGWMSKRRKHC